MISLVPLRQGLQRKLNRRDMLQLSGLGSLGMMLPEAAVRAASVNHATAKNCIYIFLCGGPSQLEMWDPKPEAPEEIRGPFGSSATNVPGIHVGGLLPKTARHADKYALIRSLNHNTTSHDTGIMYTLLADSSPPSNQAYPPVRSDHPGLGAILRHTLGESSALPAWVTIPRPFTTGARFYKGQSAGFLGPAHDPFFLDEEKKDSLADKEFEVKTLQPLEGLNVDRIVERNELLTQLDVTQLAEATASRRYAQYRKQAYRMIASSSVREAFELKREPRRLRDQYGRNEYGQSFLLARRLVESGVRMVNVFWTFYGPDGCQFNLWDNHGSDMPKVCGGPNRGVDMLTHDYCCPSFDLAFSTLLEDLTERGMLDDTLVVVIGEFGRTPKMNKWSGRDHWGACYSALLAGGGVQGGQCFGASDKQAAYVKDSPVTPEDVGATILHAFGVSPEALLYDQTDRPVRSSKGSPIAALF